MALQKCNKTETAVIFLTAIREQDSYTDAGTGARSEMPGRGQDTSQSDFRNKITLQVLSQTARTHFTAELTQIPWLLLSLHR